MSDIKLFRLDGQTATEIEGKAVTVEKSLQSLIETHLEAFFGVRFLASEYSTGKTHGGRIDTLGVDENGCPVIIEYKRSLNEAVMNQGLYYLDWLLDHRGEFTLLVQKRFGESVAGSIEWGSPRLLCIAGDFTRYDQHAVQQINRNIELVRYGRYGQDLILFELVNATTAQEPSAEKQVPDTKRKGGYKSTSDYLAQAKQDLRDRFEALRSFLMALGDDVQMKPLQCYFAFKRIKNFACVEVHPQANRLLVFVKVNPDTVELKPGFTRDVRNIGHFGTGDLEVIVKTDDDLEKVKPFLLHSYNAS